jgi:capsular polysaccharide transport system permease protein
MNRLVNPHDTDARLTQPPQGLRALILRAETSRIGNRVLSAHFSLLERLGALGYSFLVFVVLPTIVGALYLLLFASHEYESEARITVRSASESGAASMADSLTMLSAFGIGKSAGQDAFVVADYIRSRAIIEDLGGRPLMHELFSRGDIDWFSRLSSRAPFEDIWKYWNRKISAVINTQSSIVTVKARAYSPAEAHRLTDMIVRRSEALVNEISERSRSDTLKRADAEVQSAMQRVGLARQNMLEFRNKSSVINPIESASSIGKTLTELIRDKLLLENSRGSLSDVIDKNAPTQRMLQVQIDSLNRQIAELQEKLTSQRTDNVISGQISHFEELQLETQFSEKLLTIAQASYEKARMEQDKQQLYLVAVVRPSMPEKPSYPKYLTAIPMIFTVMLVLWGMVSLIIASIRDHMG